MQKAWSVRYGKGGTIMTYTNFAYYFRPHGWIQRHNPRKFYRWGQKRGRSDAARDYCLRKSLDLVIAEINEIGARHRASGYISRRTSRPAISINHVRDTDTAYYNDELAASCGL